MTTLPAVRPSTGTLGTAALAGAALGVLDLLLQLTMPYPLSDLANSSAVWALAATALAALLRPDPARAAVAGTVLLVVAVESYEVAAIALDRASPGSLWAASTVMWLLFAVVAGTVFGVAGSWLHDADPWRAAAGHAAAVAVLLAEAGVRLLPGSESGLSGLGTSLLTAGVAVAVLLVAVGRPTHLARTAALVGPLTVLGVLAFSLAGW